MVLMHDTLSEFTCECTLVEISMTVIKIQSGHDFVTNRPMNRGKGEYTCKSIQLFHACL